MTALPGYIESVIRPGIFGEVEEGAWIEPGRVRLEEGSRVERGAIVRGPTIIGRNSTVRSGAYIRGHVLTGENCLIGSHVEVRQVLMLDHSKISHGNCIFTSLVGNRVNIGGHSSTANLRLDSHEIILKIEHNGQTHRYATGLNLLGAIVGDDTKIGGMVMMQPGTILGRRCIIHPQCAPLGFIPDDSIVRPAASTLEVVQRPS